MTARRFRLHAGHIGIALAVVVVAALLLAPDIQYGSRAGNLTTSAPGPYGARGFYQTVEQLGWPVEQRRTRFRGNEPAEVTYAVLAPPQPPGALESGALLDAVRRGALLFLVPTRGSPLSDSLGITVASGISFTGVGSTPPGAPDELEYRGALQQWLVPAHADTSELPAGSSVLLNLRSMRAVHPAVVGLTLGEGRVVLLADAAILTNQRQRLGAEAVLAVRLLEWLEQGQEPRPVVFAEWHHGAGDHPNALRVLHEALLGTPPGRALLVLVLAGGALLLAIGALPLAPEPPTRIERRSPFEHVGALSRAYRQIGGTRVATRHLVRGLWRRRATAARHAPDEREYLRALVTRHPQLEPQVATVLHALEHRVADTEFMKVGEAVHTIERTLTL